MSSPPLQSNSPTESTLDTSLLPEPASHSSSSASTPHQTLNGSSTRASSPTPPPLPPSTAATTAAHVDDHAFYSAGTALKDQHPVPNDTIPSQLPPRISLGSDDTDTIMTKDHGSTSANGHPSNSSSNGNSTGNSTSNSTADSQLLPLNTSKSTSAGSEGTNGDLQKPPGRRPGRPSRLATSLLSTTTSENTGTTNDAEGARPRRSGRTAASKAPLSSSVPKPLPSSATTAQDTAPALAPSMAAVTAGGRPSLRTSTRQVRLPGKLEDTDVYTQAAATPANQRALIPQKGASRVVIDLNSPPTPPVVVKRGPGRPSSSFVAARAARQLQLQQQQLQQQQQQQQQRQSSSSPPPPPPLPVKRGPGRPPRNPAAPKVDTSASRGKAKSASPTMSRTISHSPTHSRSNSSASSKSGQATTVGRRRASSIKSATDSPTSPTMPTEGKRPPGRPKKSEQTPSPQTMSNISSPRMPQNTQMVFPSGMSPRSRKRQLHSEAEDDDAGLGISSGLMTRKRRTLSGSDSMSASGASGSQLHGYSKIRAANVPMGPPKPLTPLDKSRLAKIAEWEGKLHHLVDHHDSLTRELYHLETFTSMVTFDPVKIKSDHSDRILKYLRGFDLWSQVPDLVSDIQINTNRVSTRRSAVEQKEQLVDMLQRNVEGALTSRSVSGGETSRLGALRRFGQQAQFGSLGEYLDSFVYVDDDESTQEVADQKAKAQAELLNRIDAVRAQGTFDIKPIKPFVDPEVPKLHSHWLMEHIMTSSRLIKKEGEYQMQRARKVSKMITRHFELLHSKSEREQRQEEKRLKKLAKDTSKEVMKKWRYVDGIVRARHKALLQEEQERAGKRHLNLILEHSTQVLEGQRSTLIGTPRPVSDTATPSEEMSEVATPVTPISRLDSPALSQRQSRSPSRRSSVALSVTASTAEEEGAESEQDSNDAEFKAVEPELDDETTLANEESGSEEDDEELRGLNAEMDIPIEDLLRQYGYQLSGEDSDFDAAEDREDAEAEESARHRADISMDLESGPDDSLPSSMVDASADAEDAKVIKKEDQDVTMSVAPLVPEGEDETKMDESLAEWQNNDTQQPNGLSPTKADFTTDIASAQDQATLNDSTMTSDEIAKALPPLPASTITKSTHGIRAVKKRRLSLSELYRGPPLPFNPFGEVDDERTLDEDEPLEDQSREQDEISLLLAEKDMPIVNLLDRFNYEAESSEWSDSYYSSDSEYETIMSAQQRAKPADPRYVVSLQDIKAYKKFPTRPSSEFTDTDTEYDDNRTISIYGSDDELGLGDMLPLLDPPTPALVSDEEEEDEEASDMEQPAEGEEDMDVDAPVDLTHTGANVQTKVPFLIRHQLREYQHVGMDWLANLYANGLNGILADEMGLGKTIQTIALLAHLACDYGVWGPHLIVVPTSVMLNWEMEFKKWCPGFKIMTYYGSPRERKEKRVGWSRENSFHVCITSYQLVVQDQSVFRRKQWQYLILDEAHNIKNFRSQRWQTLLNFNSARRLLLTGTPLQNNLMELWSLLYFLMPNGVSQTMPVGFANQKEFQDWFSHPVDRMIEGNEQMDEDSKAAVARLHTVLRPYLLRRLKADVETQMPAKYEHVVYCRLSKRQRFLYDDFMSRAKTRETLASGNFLSIINCLMQLRKVCNHPDLFEVRPIVTSFAMPSAIASYEIQEFLVRRVLLNEVEQARERVNLEFLGFTFTQNETKADKITTDLFQQLDASPLFFKKAAEFGTVQTKTLQASGLYQDVRQWATARKHQLMQSGKQLWEHLGYVNENRCKVSPIYGSSLLSLCQQRPKKAAAAHVILDQVDDPRQYLQYTDALANAVLRPDQRFSRDLETTKRFAFVTPAVMIKDPRWAPLQIHAEPTSMDLMKHQFEDVFHPIESCLQVQFPDKRLLQYDCGKLQKLDSLLRELKSGGHRALIFTQMTKMLDVLEIFLNIHGHRYLRLDGATKVENRQHLTDRFNSDPKILCFILSTRSGGVGINLTGADTVIFYDSDWNPSMDRQCQDRCHRIGQTRDVHIYRFVSEYTIEENMLKKANQKRLLDNVVIQEGEFTTDYFQKMDWRDMLGEDDLAKIGDLGPVQKNGVPTDLSTVQGADLEQALAAAEDESDVLAMRQAKHEMEGVDQNDFSEGGPASKDAAGPSTQQQQQQQTRVQFADQAPASSRRAFDEDGEEIMIVEMGHVDDYMLRLAEREYGHYVGFGGLPEPEPTEDDDLEGEAFAWLAKKGVAEDTPTPKDGPESDEEEDDDEESDEYDVEDSEEEEEEEGEAGSDGDEEDGEGDEDGAEAQVDENEPSETNQGSDVEMEEAP